MAEPTFDALKSAFAAQALFEDKSWRLSPDAWSVPAAQALELEAIGAAALEFHQALESLYLRGRTCCATSRSWHPGSPTTSSGASRRSWSPTAATRRTGASSRT